MNKMNKLVIFFMSIFVMLSVNAPKASATTYKEMDKKLWVELDKEWVVKFNQDIDEATVNNNNIVILDEKDTAINIMLHCNDGKTVKVSPASKYESGKTYTFIVKQGLKTKKGKNLKSPTKMVFTTRGENLEPVDPKGYEVVIDAANAANLSYDIGPTGVKEKDVNLAIAFKLGNILKSKGIEVAYTRTGDTVSWNQNHDESERIRIANEFKAKTLININCNSYSKSQAYGIETYYLTNDDEGKTLAEDVQKNIISSTSGKNRGTKERNNGILKDFKGTGILVYPGFITNPQEEKLLNTEGYQKKVAQAIANGFLNNRSNLNTNIKSVNDVTINLTQGDAYWLPSKIPAVNTDNKTIQAKVVWETSSVNTGKVGTINIKGTVENYDKPVNIHIIVSPKVTSKIKVAIDPGHGAYDSGAVGPTGVKEKDVTLSVGLKLGDILSRNGIEVIYTRTSDDCPWPSDKSTELQMRCDIANNANADYFVSIHANSATQAATGTETYYSRDTSAGIPLATNIQKEIIKETGSKDRGIKPCGFYVVKNTNMPAVLVELEFLSNPKKEQMLNNSVYQQKYAEAIARGIMDTVNK